MRMMAMALATMLALCSAQAQDLRQLLSQAARAAAQGDIAAAEAAYERAFAAGADDEERAEVLSQQGDMRRGRADREGAVRAWARALELGGSGPWRARCLGQLGGLAQQVARLDLAREAYVRLAEDFADQPNVAGQAELNLCRLDANAAEPEPVIARLEGLLEPRYPSMVRIQARYLLVEVLLRAGQLERAGQVAGAEEENSGARADLLLMVAAELQEAGQLPEAARLCRQVLAEQPGHGAATRCLYEVASQEGTVEDLKAELARAAEAEGGEAALRQLAEIYTWEGDPRPALAVYEKLVALAPGDAELLVQAGGVARDCGALDRAARWLEEALRLSPDHRLAAEALGGVYARQGEHERAVELLKRSTGYRPDDLMSARALGRILSEYSLHRQAVELYQQAREQSGDRTLLAVEMGRAWVGLLEYGRATGEFLTALSDPMQGATMLVSYELMKLARDEVASEVVVAALDEWLQRPDMTDGQGLAAARAYLAAGRPERALELFARLGPAVGADVADLARETDLSGDSALAARLYELALGYDQAPRQQAGISLRLAEVRLESGEWTGALELLERAAQVDDYRAEAELVRAEALLRHARDVPAARTAYRAVLETPYGADGYGLRAQWGLADCLFAEARWDDATAAYLELMARPAEAGFELPPLPPGLTMPRLPRPELFDARGGDERTSAAYGAYQLAEIALRRGDLDAATERYAALAAEHRASVWANDALARLVFMHENLDGSGEAEGRYLAALIALERGGYDEVRGLALAIAESPDEALADDALMLLGGALCEQRKWQEAVEVYLRLATEMPDSLLAPAALLASARLLRDRLDNPPAARVHLEAVVDGYPRSAAADEARHLLRSLLPAELSTRD